MAAAVLCALALPAAPAVGHVADPFLRELELPPGRAWHEALAALGNSTFKPPSRLAANVHSAMRLCMAALPAAYNGAAPPMDTRSWVPGNPCGFSSTFAAGLQRSVGAGPLHVLGDSTSSYWLRRLLHFGSRREGPMFTPGLKAVTRRGTSEGYLLQTAEAPAPTATAWWATFTTRELADALPAVAKAQPRLVVANAGLHDFDPLYRLREGHDSRARALAAEAKVLQQLRQDWVGLGRAMAAAAAPAWAAAGAGEGDPPPLVLWRETYKPHCPGLRWGSKKFSRWRCKGYWRLLGAFNTTLRTLLWGAGVVVVPSAFLLDPRTCEQADGIHLSEDCRLRSIDVVLNVFRLWRRLLGPAGGRWLGPAGTDWRRSEPQWPHGDCSIARCDPPVRPDPYSDAAAAVHAPPPSSAPAVSPPRQPATAAPPLPAPGAPPDRRQGRRRHSAVAAVSALMAGVATFAAAGAGRKCAVAAAAAAVLGCLLVAAVAG
eukprot:TRINITY_DN27224_c0_g1_i1.p1 TRINITY_DN27224_c0_g1~~TRINITY_DN27224_c0_g1_i1.p1  ORF type:complete len:504 (+),score=193.37 TRINITY_DN27224_c0_g1_i1:51-1514(+)